MHRVLENPITTKPVHTWLRKLQIAFVPGPVDALLEGVAERLLDRFETHGHQVQPTPGRDTDVILTTARFGEPVSWREALFFTARRRYNLNHNPTIYTMISVAPEGLDQALEDYRVSLEKEPPDPSDFERAGLAPGSFHVLLEQGRRGGPILALERQIQAQAKSIRVLLVVGDEHPLYAFHFDLVGAHPRSEADGTTRFYDDIVLRVLTAMSTYEITEHEVVEAPIPQKVWRASSVPAAMRAAARQLGRRDFFTDMVRIADLVHVPAVSEGVASQYSEGCFATWDPTLEALVTTVTGSARPVDKGDISEDDMAVIVDVRSDGKGAVVRHVKGKRNDPPSSEAVELMDMDSRLPKVHLDPPWGVSKPVPVVRSKLHGHRGIAAFNPDRAEHVRLDPPYYHYPVSCATEAQARGIKAAFARSEALQDPEDPRQIVFTVLPGHGIVVVEKWVPGKAPFQAIWEAIDSGDLEVENRVPQGPLSFTRAADGRMVLEEV